MPRGINPYYADAGSYDAIGQGVNNLASLFLQTPDAARGAQADALAWRARESREGVRDAQRARAGQHELADIFENYTPETYDPRAVMGAALRNNVYKDPSALGNLFLAAAGNLPGMTDDQRVGAMVGTGRPLSSTSSVSREHQTALLDNAARREIEVAQAKGAGRPLSRDELVADTAVREGAEAAARLRERLYGGRGSDTNPLLDATRRADLERDVDETITIYAEDMGLEPSQVTPATRTRLLGEAMERVLGGQTPRNAVGDLFTQLNARAEGTGLFDGDPRLAIDERTDPHRTASTQGAGGVPAPDQREPGKIYQTPRGPMIWTVDPATGESGWLPAGA